MIRLKRFYAHDFKQLREFELHFPEAGRILVQGRNEAGKSTLFEAVFFALFGQALATESAGRPNLDDLIGYEKNKARVELDLAVRERLFRITRTLNRGKPNVWELEIADGDRIEEIRGNRSVNDRLVSEFGFDAEALLNTCFVEQKKLEKLEGLNKNKREESLSKLLNLERLLDLEERLRIRSEDEKMRARLAKRLELAQAQHDLPSAEKDLTQAETQLKMIELCVQIGRALEEKRVAVTLRAQLDEMYALREELKAAAGAVDALDLGRRAIANAVDRFDLLAQQNAGLDAMRREQAETANAVRQHLPDLDHRSRELGRLKRNLERLNQVASAHQSAAIELERLEGIRQELVANQERGGELEAAIAQLESRGRELETHLHDYDVGDALAEWASLAGEAIGGTSGTHPIEEKKRLRERAASRFRVWLVMTTGVTAILVAGTILIPLALFYFSRSIILALGFGAGLAVLDVSAATVLIGRAKSLWEEFEQTSADLAKAEGEFAARKALVTSTAKRLNAAERRLCELSVAIPITPLAAQSHRIEIAASLENKTREELSAERDQARAKLSYAHAQRDEILRKSGELQLEADRGDRARWEKAMAKAERILDSWRPRLSERAQELNTLPELQAVINAKQEVDVQGKSWQVRIEQAAKLTHQIKEGQERVNRISLELRRAYESARELLDGRFGPWSPELPRAGYLAMGTGLAEAFELRGGDQARRRFNSVEKEIGASERELKLRDKAALNAVVSIRALLEELRFAQDRGPQAQAQELEGLAERFKHVQLEDRSVLEMRVKTVQMRVGALRHTRDTLERELGLQGEEIDRAAAQDEFDKECHVQEERRFGAEIVMRARKRIVQKVLPATMDYMRRILPQLTRDRYHDAELDPDTFKIKVWDERAGQSGAWKEKNIFSGGTKDQFSLALRLAFALATLPQERGASPGFIFLDEPLGSFDDERAAALLYLLTEGEIAHAFDQIFLISHVRVQVDRFTHHIRLENGALVEGNLNSPAA
jgi:DNA repair protein SbcC/Rad50